MWIEPEVSPRNDDVSHQPNSLYLVYNPNDGCTPRTIQLNSICDFNKNTLSGQYTVAPNLWCLELPLHRAHHSSDACLKKIDSSNPYGIELPLHASHSVLLVLEVSPHWPITPTPGVALLEQTHFVSLTARR